MEQCVKKNVFSVALVNARSLKNKLDSLCSNMKELATDLCIITETWFKPSDSPLNKLLEDFKNKTCYEFIRKDRAGPRRGGGIAFCYNNKRIQLSKAKIPPTKHEVFAAIGRRTGQRRR